MLKVDILGMPKQLTKSDIKEAVLEVIEPFAEAIQGDLRELKTGLKRTDDKLDKLVGSIIH